MRCAQIGKHARETLWTNSSRMSAFTSRETRTSGSVNNKLYGAAAKFFSKWWISPVCWRTNAARAMARTVVGLNPTPRQASKHQPAARG